MKDIQKDIILAIEIFLHFEQIDHLLPLCFGKVIKKKIKSIIMGESDYSLLYGRHSKFNLKI